MRSIWIAVLLSTGLWADSIEITSIDGGMSSLSISNGSLVNNGDFDMVIYQGSGNDNAGFCYDPCGFTATTGPLIQSGGSQWIFASGGEIAIGGITGVGTLDGSFDYQSCLDEGLFVNPYGKGPCGADAYVNGYFTGDVVMSATIHPGVYTLIAINGPVSFSISDTMGVALGIAAGEYDGQYSAFAYSWGAEPSGELAGFNAGISYGQQRITGSPFQPPSQPSFARFVQFAVEDVQVADIPEPSGWLLMTSVIAFLALLATKASR